MASATEDDDAWLYGDNEKTDAGATNERSSDSKSQADDSTHLQNKDESQQDDREAGELSCEDEQGQQSEEGPATDPVEADGEAKGPSFEADKNGDAGDGADEDEDDDDDDDDDVQVTIRDIKTSPYASYPGPTQTVNLNIKRGPPFTSNLGPGSGVPGVGKTKGLDIDEVALINGTSIYEFNIESLEDKPWRKPGADITDYFNYGFNEDTWKVYCDRQRKLRSDNNVPIKDWRTGRNEVYLGDAQLAWQQQRQQQQQQQQGTLPPEPLLPQVPIPPVNENSKYTGVVIGVPPPPLGGKKAGPPPGRKMSGSIDVIGGGAPSLPSRRPGAAKEGVIQVIGSGDQPLGGITLPPTHMPPPGYMGMGLEGLGVPPPIPGMIPGIPPPGYETGAFPPPRFTHPPPPLPGSTGGGPGGDRGSSYGDDGRSSYYNGASGYGQSYGDDGGGSGGGSWSGRERSERSHGERGDRGERERDRERERPSSRRDYDDEERRESRRYREYYRERERERDRDRERDRRERGGGGEDEYEETSSSSRYERRHREHRGDKEERERHRSSRRRHHRGGDDEEEEERRSSKHKHKRSKKERPPVEEVEVPSSEAGGVLDAGGDESKAD
ncbi:factor interacting with poly(A) polymerase 1 isoform X3 [Rhipicephalus microplus]|uniref:factor interacting with poly(A) polymerase 1 isoform X3 n=1 Tax=Rhipicephalus microplus TaxID=6941 RepID=UPI003F6BD016